MDFSPEPPEVAPEWLRLIALQVHGLVSNPLVLRQFCEKVKECSAERHDAGRELDRWESERGAHFIQIVSEQCAKGYCTTRLVGSPAQGWEFEYWSKHNSELKELGLDPVNGKVYGVPKGWEHTAGWVPPHLCLAKRPPGSRWPIST